MSECQHGADRSVPDDIAKLYLVASLPGHTYRDFSASRRETRAYLRRKMLEEKAGEATGSSQRQKENFQPKLEDQPPQEQIAPSGSEREAWSSQKISSAEKLSSPIAGVPADAEKSRLEPVEPHVPAFSLRDIPSTTQQPSAELGASRWFVLKNIFAPESALREDQGTAGQAAPAIERTAPTVAFFSIAGGVGKTSLAATVGRALAAYGERVLLVDTTPFGLLPLYFGSREAKPGIVRTFAPPNNSPDAPVHVVTLEPSGDLPEAGRRDPFLEQVLRDAHGSTRILVDVRTAAASTMARLLPIAPTVVVPLFPDMNSVASLESVEAVFSNQTAGQRYVAPLYLLNEFDESLPLHIDVREILRQQLGNRLLPFVMGRSPAVSEALAEGMTVMDYAPDSDTARGFLHLAGWLRSLSAAGSGSRQPRWSER